MYFISLDKCAVRYKMADTTVRYHVEQLNSIWQAPFYSST